MESNNSLWNKISEDSARVEHSLDQLHRKQTGSYYTGLDLAYAMMQEMVGSFSVENKRAIHNLRFLEPCVGTGNFVFSYLRVCRGFNLSNEEARKLIDNIYVCDINKEALSVYKENMKLVAKEWYGVSLSDRYFDRHIGTGLIFDVAGDDIEYLPLKEIFGDAVVNEGFDLVVTNPPYKNLKAERGHYHSEDEYNRDRDKYKKITKLAKEHFPYSSLGTLNIYKMFVEEIMECYLRDDGIGSLLIPSSILSDKSCSKLRTRLLDTCALKSVRLIEENSDYVDASQALCAILFHKGKRTEKIRVDGSFDGNIKQGIYVPFDDIVDEMTGNAVLVLTENEYSIHKSMKQHPAIRDLSFIHNMRGELDLTLDKQYLTSKPTPYRFYRGRNIGYYKIIDLTEKEYAIEKFVEKSPKQIYIHKERIICQQIVNMSKKRRVAYTLIPSECVLGNSCNYISLDDNEEGVDIYFLLGILNSTLIDWFFKLTSSNNHINNYEIDNFPIPIHCKEKENISMLVKRYLNNQDENLITEIDALVYKAFGITDNASSGDLSKEQPYVTTDIKTDDLNDVFYANLVQIIPKISREDCQNILDGQATVEDITFAKKPDITDFEKKVAEGIERKYKMLNEGYILNHTTFKLSDLDLEMIKSVPQGGSWKDIPQETVKKSKRLERITQTGGRTTLYGRIDYSKPSYTITTYFNRPGNGTYVHPMHERVLSVREAARFQCFPDDYYFMGNKTDMLKQVGNAVPAIFAYQIAKNIVRKTGCTKSIDLFSGAGGMTYGFKRAGIDAVIANDFEKSACLTLKANNPEIDVLCGDITDETTKKQIIEKGIKGNAEIICGGPPCQGFSMAGFRKDDDPRNQLFKHFVDIVSTVNPKIIVFENVEGLLSYKKGETYRDIIQLFSELGYVTEGRTLLTSEYGVPQRRKRVIIICTRKDINITPSELYPDVITPEIEKQVTAFETISDLEEVECAETAKYHSEYSSAITKYFKHEISLEDYLEQVTDKDALQKTESDMKQISIFDYMQ